MAIELHHLHPSHDDELSRHFTVSDSTVSPCIKIDKRHIDAIAHEYWAAKEKHPDFCKTMIDDEGNFYWEHAEIALKNRNKKNGNGYADDVLLEEVAEAFNAYQKGDKAQALQEFAQCGAVILRIMEKIEKEMLP